MHVLHHSAKGAHVTLTHHLVEFLGIDVDKKDSTGRTILHIAVPRNSGGYFGHVLAKLEPSIDMKDNLGLTPLQLSILLGQYISEFLLAIAKCNPITTQHILSCSIYCQANMLRCKN
jgi:ankyrin repeat protein